MNKARANVSVIDPIANVSFVLPVAAVSYIELLASAELDQSGRYPYVVDTYIVADTSLVDFAKSLQSGVNPSGEISAIGVGKSAGDSVNLSDEVYPLLILLRSLFDQISVGDSDLLEFGKNLLEAIEASDEQRNLSYQKNLTENQDILEALAVGFAGELTDIAPVGDVVNFINGWARIFDETTVATDVYDRVVSWNPSLGETPAITEVLSNSYEKPFSDEATPQDDSIQSLEYARSFSDSNILVNGYSNALNALLLNETTLNNSPGAETYQFSIGKNPSETLLTDDAFDRVVAWFPLLTDTADINDLLASVIGKPLSDASIAEDSLVFENSFNRSVSDLLITGDAASSTVFKGASDSVSVSETFDYEKVAAQPHLLNARLLNDAILNAS